MRISKNYLQFSLRASFRALDLALDLLEHLSFFLALFLAFSLFLLITFTSHYYYVTKKNIYSYI